MSPYTQKHFFTYYISIVYAILLHLLTIYFMTEEEFKTRLIKWLNENKDVDGQGPNYYEAYDLLLYLAEQNYNFIFD